LHRAWLIAVIVVGVAFSVVLSSDRALAASTTGTVRIVYPLSAASLGVEGTRVQLSVSNFVLDPNVSPGCADPTHGRARLYLNDVFVQETSDTNTSLTSLATTHTKLGAQLVCTDGSSFSPQVWNNITIKVGEPELKFLNPGRPLMASTAGARLAYSITNFSLDPADYAGPYIPGQGHVHLLRDGAFFATSTALYADVSSFLPGPFTLTVELHNNDHSLVKTATHPFGYNDTIPAVGVVPSVRIIAPSSGGSVSASGFRLTVAVTGIELDSENYAGARIPGHGHLHYFIDGGGLAATSTTPYVDFGALPVGAHTIKAELHNNDHSLYVDPAHPFGFNATVTVNVAQTSISILTPANSAAVSTGGFRLELAVQGLDISPANYGGTNVPGQGHIHVFDGGSLIGTTTSTTFDVGPLVAGAHTIKAELHNNDHSLFTDSSHPYGFNATITVSASGPSITIKGPANNAPVSTLGTRVSVMVLGFLLDAADYGGTNIAGEGHIHYYVDGALAAATVATYFDISSLTAGSHTIRAELRNNDHSALSPPVFAQITVIAGPSELKILEPVTGATASTLGFRMRFAISNFSLDPLDYAGVAIPGQGHVHVYNGATLLTTTVYDHVVITGLPAGAVTLRAELRNNDHTPLATPVTASVTVTIAAPAIVLSAPASMTVGQGLNVSWVVTGFVLDSAAFGGAPEPGRGHVHIFVDGTYVTATAATSYVLTNLAVGPHALKVKLYNNDHSEIGVNITSTATVTVNEIPAPPPATVAASVFYTSVGLLAVFVAVLAALLVRKGRKGPPESMEPERVEVEK